MFQDRLEKKDRPGLAIGWYRYLLKAAQKTKDKGKIIEHARYLFIDGFREEEDYYVILKRHVDVTNWVAFVNQLIVDLTNKRGHDSRSISEIYITEKWWEKLLEWVKKNASLEHLCEYEKYLKKDYAPELIKMYAAGTIKYLANNMSREHYQKAGGYIKKIADLGDRDTAYQLIEQFKNNYPKRKAMIEELEAVQNKTNLTDENYYNKVRL